MDPEQRARRQSLRIIISEVFMVVAVVITVAILAFIVSGYWVNSDFRVERQGMVQVSSVPTGAELFIDGETAWNQRTNTSKVLSSGEHTISLSKEGYDSWSRTVNIKEGLLYRIQYPRLFLNDRKKEVIMDVSSATFASFSPNRERLLLANNTNEWQIVDVSKDKPDSKNTDVAKVLTSISLAPDASKGLFTGKIISADWSSNNERVLLHASADGSDEWAILDINDSNRSINLTKEFNADLERVEIFDDSANNLLAIIDGNLHKIDIGAKQISAVLARDVADYDYYNSDIVFSAKLGDEKTDTPEEAAPSCYIGIIKGSNTDEIQRTKTCPLVAISRFYDEHYLMTYDGKILSLYKKEKADEKTEYEVEIDAKKIVVGHEGEFVTMTHEGEIATLDMEAMKLTRWNTDAAKFGWLDRAMIYSVNENNLYVYDFDGLNRRLITKNVSSHYPVTVTSDKWLYYFSDGDLVRETIRD